jgi:hypothetical protein
MPYEKLASCIYSRATKQAAFINPELIRKGKLFGSRALDSVGITRGLENRVLKGYAKAENDRLARLAKKKILPAGILAGAAGGVAGARYSTPIMNKLDNYLPELSFIPGSGKVKQQIPAKSPYTAQELADAEFMNKALPSKNIDYDSPTLDEANFMHNAGPGDAALNSSQQKQLQSIAKDHHVDESGYFESLPQSIPNEVQKFNDFQPRNQNLFEQVQQFKNAFGKIQKTVGSMADQTQSIP